MLISVTVSVYAQPPKVDVDPLHSDGDTLYWYLGASATFRVTAEPGCDSMQFWGRLVSSDSSRGEFIIPLEHPLAGITPVCVQVWKRGMASEDCCMLVVYNPKMKGGLRRWPAMSPKVGTKLNPASDWIAREEQFPNDTYQTVVEVDGHVIYEQVGTSVTDADLPESLRVFGMTAPLTTKVYWRPYATPNRNDWVLLASSTPDVRAVVDLNDKGNW